jgi:hypothetical protein
MQVWQWFFCRNASCSGAKTLVSRRRGKILKAELRPELLAVQGQLEIYLRPP